MYESSRNDPSLAPVHRIAITDSNATGAELTDDRDIAAREVILCAGTSSSHLMLSAICPSAILPAYGILPCTNLR